MFRAVDMSRNAFKSRSLVRFSMESYFSARRYSKMNSLIGYFCAMIVPFKKYHGTGNDFVMIDNMTGAFHLSDEQVVKLCDRHFGIGSDGLILLEKAQDGLHFSMNFFNPDASKSFCG